MNSMSIWTRALITSYERNKRRNEQLKRAYDDTDKAFKEYRHRIEESKAES